MIEEKLTEISNAVQDFKDKSNERLDEIEAKAAKAIEVEKKMLNTEESVQRISTILNDYQGELENIRALLRAINSDNKTKSGTFDEYVGHLVLGTMLGNGCSNTSREWLTRNNALTEGTTSTGGALVPSQFVPELIDLLSTYGVFRNEARNVPMASDTSIWPKLTAGLTVYSPGEAGTITASNPTFSNVQLIAKKLATLTAVSSELAEDSALAVGNIVGDEIVRAMAKAEDEAGFLGDGTSTYWGYVGLAGAMARNTNGIVDGAATGGQVSASGDTWGDITIADIRLLISILPQRFAGNARFYCSKPFYWTVLVPLMQTEYGTTMRDLEGGPNMMIEGYPVTLVDVMPSSTAVGQYCLWLADLKSGAYFGDRRMMSIEQSRDVYFASDQVGIRGTERFAINVFGEGTTSVAGPICALQTALD